ncbi:acyltransferase [Microbacterium betulae]|uniref:Acyltransferase n=1 Tax=Microbacterium betulae TaxID=2981139 RepID=A0AA97FJF3_9MICO|nr:acyltransferase [Microbacterium sp. AB]WOF22642.1 acyltransferase [Microbacterium sp. AB]
MNGRRGVAYEEFQATGFFSGLDGLRAFAVVAVIWQHTSGNPGPELLSQGGFGVDLFFAISGFLITTLLLRERRRNGRIALRSFAVRRVFRIMPVYYAVLVVYVVLVLATRRGTPEGDGFLANLPAFLTYTSNWFVDLDAGPSVPFYFAWSLATEEQFYLFWPPLLALLLFRAARSRAGGSGGIGSGGRRAAVAPLAALGALVAVGQLAIAQGSRDLPIVILSSLALPILLGAAMAVLLDHRPGFEAVAPWVSARWFAPVAAAGVLASLAWQTPTQLTQVLMVLLVASVGVSESTLLHPLLRWPPIAHVGAVSYGMYLMHMLCANALRPALGERFGIPLFVLTTVLAVIVASVSRTVFEAPLQRVGRRLSEGMAARRERPPSRAGAAVSRPTGPDETRR